MTNLIAHKSQSIIEIYTRYYVLFEIHENYSTSYFGKIIQGYKMCVLCNILVDFVLNYKMAR